MLKRASGRARWRRRSVAAGVAAVGVLGGGYAAAAAATAGTVPRDTTVAGVEVGGLDRDRAGTALTDGLADRSTEPVPVTVQGGTDQLDPAASGLVLDVPATVDRALGTPWAPATLWRHAVGGGEVQAVSDVDEAALAAALEELSERVGTPPVDGAITFEAVADGGEPTVVEPREGRVLDVEDATELLARQWVSAPRPVELPTEVGLPEVDAEEVADTLERFAEPAVSGPLEVRVGEVTTTVGVDVLAPLLSTAVEDGELVGQVDGAGLAEVVLAATPGSVAPPQDARIEIVDGAPRVVPGVAGTTVEPQTLAEAAVAALEQPAGSGERVVTAEMTASEPELTTAEVEALGVVEKISEFSTTLTPDPPRTENITIAARAVNGTLLEPGETFSLNGVLGERTPDKGYNKAGVIQGGKLAKDYGGGVSQLATTLFNGMFFAGLDEVEHKAHSLYFSRYPEGREATVAWPSVDLKFTNDSGKGVLIETWVAGGEVHTAFWGTKVYDVEATKGPRRNLRTPESRVETGPDCTPQSPITGFDVTVTRTFRQGGAVVRTEEFRTTYNKLDAVRCEQAPAQPPGEAAEAAPDAPPDPAAGAAPSASPSAPPEG